MKTFLIQSIITMLILCSCSKEQESIRNKSHFSIHFLKDSLLKMEDIKNLDLSLLQLNPTPWLSASDIISYDFSSHIIYLKNSKNYYFSDSSSPFELPENFWHKPFVVVANNKPCYVGYFYPSVCAKIPEGIYITDDYYIYNYADDILHISNNVYRVCKSADYPDIRNNLLIKDALIEDNIFSDGLEINIDTVVVVVNSDTTIIKYTFSITNNDKDNLYVLDPNLMDNKVFLFIKHKIISEYTCFSSNDHIVPITHNPFDNWNTAWFTKIESKKSIIRTLSFKEYPPIYPGEYCCYLKFTSPFNIKKDERLLTDGRYWIGEILSDMINIKIE